MKKICRRVGLWDCNHIILPVVRMTLLKLRHIPEDNSARIGNIAFEPAG